MNTGKNFEGSEIKLRFFLNANGTSMLLYNQNRQIKVFVFGEEVELKDIDFEKDARLPGLNSLSFSCPVDLCLTETLEILVRNLYLN